MSLFFPCTIETGPGRLSGWNRSTVQSPARPDTGSNFQSGGSAEAAPSWHGGSEQWVQHPAGCQDSLGDGDRHVPPAAGGRNRVSTHMALCVGLGFVSSLPLSNCFGVGLELHCPVLSHRELSEFSEQVAIQAGLLKLLWNFEVALPAYRLSLCELGSWVDVHMPGTPVMQFLISLSLWVKQKVEIPPGFYLFSCSGSGTRLGVPEWSEVLALQKSVCRLTVPTAYA